MMIVGRSILLFFLCIFHQIDDGDFFIFQSRIKTSRTQITSISSYNLQQSWQKTPSQASPPSLIDDNVSNDVTILTLDGFSFQVLKEFDLNQAADLVAQAHFQPHGPPPSLSVLSPLFHPFYIVWNQFLLLHLTNKIKAGFHYRARDRLIQPHVGYSDDSIIIVARHHSTREIVGIVEAYPSNPSYVCNLSVSSKFRRQGLGKQLCQIVEDFLSIQWNISSIYLHVDQSNLAARKLYESLDYQISDNPIVYKTEQNLYFPKRVYVEYIKRLSSTSSTASVEDLSNIVSAPSSTINIGTSIANDRLE